MDRNTASFACNTYSYTISLGAEACLLHLADLGFTDFELMIYPGHLWPPNDETASRAALRRFGLSDAAAEEALAYARSLRARSQPQV